MLKRTFEPCFPTRATKVPTGPDWLHEIKYDGYRLIVQRDGKQVRLFTRNGNDWTKRYPLIVESALRNKSSRFVIEWRSGAARRRRRVRFRRAALPQAR
jgi:bifunctional non-homologous end joining protein LigD